MRHSMHLVRRPRHSVCFGCEQTARAVGYTIITASGVRIGLGIPVPTIAACIKAGQEHASAVNLNGNSDEIKETWWQCEREKKEAKKPMRPK